MNKYSQIHAAIFFNLLSKRKVNPVKIWNYFLSKVSRLLKLSKPLNYPVLVNLELWNECNEACLFCRSRDGLIFRGDGTGTGVAKGKADLTKIFSTLDQLRKHLLFAIPYVNGEPLISPILGDVLNYLKENQIASVVATNGISLDQRRRTLLIDSDLDLLKVHISGMTNEVHQIEHRQGKVNKILENVIKLSEEIKKRKSGMIVMLDFIEYKHNQHEVDIARKFAETNGLIFNLRPGNPDYLEGEDDNRLPLVKNGTPCDWVWEAFTVDWDDAVLPCCDFVLWRDHFNSLDTSRSIITEQWFSGRLYEFRKKLVSTGRSHNVACKNCSKTKVGFKY